MGISLVLHIFTNILDDVSTHVNKVYNIGKVVSSESEMKEKLAYVFVWSWY